MLGVSLRETKTRAYHETVVVASISYITTMYICWTVKSTKQADMNQNFSKLIFCLILSSILSGEGNVAFNATPNAVLLSKICLNQAFFPILLRLVIC